MGATLVIFWDGADPRNAGWAGCLSDDEQQTSFTLPHRRRDVSLGTLARSTRREFRGADLPTKQLVRGLCERLHIDYVGTVSAPADPFAWRASL